MEIFTVPPSLYNLPTTPGSEVGKFVKSICEPSIVRLPLALIAPPTVNVAGLFSGYTYGTFIFRDEEI